MVPRADEIELRCPGCNGGLCFGGFFSVRLCAFVEVDDTGDERDRAGEVLKATRDPGKANADGLHWGGQTLYRRSGKERGASRLACRYNSHFGSYKLTLNPHSLASSHRRSISCSVASSFRRVWSISWANSGLPGSGQGYMGRQLGRLASVPAMRDAHWDSL
jgi:hypothetical protein